MFEQDISAETIAAGLYATGFEPGDKAALFIDQHALINLLSEGILRCGGSPVLVNNQASDEVLIKLLSESAVATIFVDSVRYGHLKRLQSATKLRRIISVTIDTPERKQRWLFDAARHERAIADAIQLQPGDMLLRRLLKLGRKTEPPGFLAIGG